MRSLWSDSDARAAVEKWSAAGEDVALRVYTSRLIGAEPDLVLHGGGNTSVKTAFLDPLGTAIPAIHVKGSGWDLASIEPAGLPGMDLEALRRLRALDALSDEAMVNQQRIRLFDAGAPTPSVETLLHAFLPAKFIDHSHADAILALTNRPDGEKIVADLFGPSCPLVPYVMPGFALAKFAAAVAEEAVNSGKAPIGLVLLKHGLFTWGETAQESYERHVERVDRAERWLQGSRRRSVRIETAVDLQAAEATAALVAPILRGRLAEATSDTDRPFRRFVLDRRATAEILEVVNAAELAEIADSNPLTPDHTIRTKPRPLVIAPPAERTAAAWTEAISAAVERFAVQYRGYVQAGIAARGPKKSLDAVPRVVLIPGVGLFAVGASRKEARIAGDIAEHTLRAKRLSWETGAVYEALADVDLFDLEYWSLEQAKLGKAAEKPLARQVAAITGAAGAIGQAIAAKLLEAGAHVALLDLDLAAAETLRSQLAAKFGSATVEAISCDVTDEASTVAAFDEICRRFGGVDLAVPNAGIARSAPLAQLSAEEFRRVVEVNTTGVFLTIREAAARMQLQGTGGNIVVISSKNVMAPGAEFGAYSASKAAAAQLAKVAALELAKEGIRVNSIAPDAIFGTGETPSGLWAAVGPDRAKARGMAPEDLPDFYRRRSLLQVPLSGEHVGNVVVFFASNLTPTTGATLPVDGGLAEAFPR
ncbi:MAG TPA: bifunctional aldolase/short-chain dehydrogenase [Thermoanaerobaculia bacterium]|jgi:rhamnulose-1-phosphate aldolase/alcohol dehydrogenase|nr:bifunctional aldolase/short-chain dehydrogenase [Thermoanaerobaculia bacterium]